jgi:SAM-dependent methyltransferase
MARTIVNHQSAVYYKGQYWNDLPEVLAYMSECFTGDPAKWWVADFKDRYCARPFDHGLFLNCGNGWVEREFLDRELVRRATAFDYSRELLCDARDKKGSRPIDYFRSDCNELALRGDQFDLVVNVAALHHVQYLDRTCRVLCRALRPDGMFVNYDYIGPSRNQYPLSQWFRILRANRSLPDGLRKPRLARPSLLIMLRTDPTEAIHASLVPDTIARYFSILERHDAGGGIAYPILTHNPKLAEASREVVERHVPRLLAVDRQETSDGKVPPMFSYFLCRPDKAALADPERLHEWEEEENRREAWATRHRGVYSWPQYIELQTVLRARHLVRRIATRVAGPLNSQPAG